MFRFLLFPISAVWASVMHFRRKFYANGRRIEPKIPTVCVGNLCMGGSGKTPHVDYLLNLLQSQNKTAVLSRGYGRKTKGFLFADSQSTAQDVGDEPLLLYRKNPETIVAVCENRVEGLRKITEKIPDIDVVILDDAYQYLKLKYGLSILLTDYYASYPIDYVFPVGKLRESRSAAKDADMIVVAKSPKVMPDMDKHLFLNKIRPLPHQKVYFSYIEYGELQPLTASAQTLDIETVRSVVTVSGIANPYLFLDYVNHKYREKEHIRFSDHHVFKKSDIDKMLVLYNRIIMRNRAIITTEKDAMRLMTSELWQQIAHLPIFSIPIEVKFHEKYRKDFENQITKYVSGKKKFEKKTVSLQSKLIF
ncbi:MAG: tetraacyldisaccharide 4'-kinase [Lentimicrobiaceae bacterium]|nr:tetraacyldisaccharide 4'-kinase [Lentimicrobiaceae bacterium]